MSYTGYGPYVNVTASRAKATTYTNTNSVPILVEVYCQLNGTSQTLMTLSVGGVEVNSIGQLAAGAPFVQDTLTAIVNPGVTYKVDGSGTILRWVEALASESGSGTGEIGWQATPYIIKVNDNGTGGGGGGTGSTYEGARAGDIKWVSYNIDKMPVGWQQCNGDAVSRTTYAQLFARIGTAYGAGNGSTTFNIPDLRGRFMASQTAGATGANRSQINIGQVGGSKDAVVVSHTHAVSLTTSGYDNPQGGNYPVNTDSREITGPFTTGNVVIQSAGESGTDKNLPPYVGMMAIIKMTDEAGYTGTVLQAGQNITITQDGTNTIISSTGGGGGGSVIAGKGIVVANTPSGALVSADVVSVTAQPGSGISVQNTDGNIVLSGTGGAGVFSKSYSSDLIAYPSATNIIRFQGEHNLGTQPTLIQAACVNQIAQYNWQPGNEIAWGNDYCPGYYYVQMGADNTNIWLIVAGLVLVGNRTTPGAGGAAIAKANWKWKIRAWA